MGLMVKPVNVLLVLLIQCASVRCFPQVTIPDTPAGHKLTAWLEAFNRGDREAYKEFLQRNYPSGGQRADQALAFREVTGGFDPRKVEPSAAGRPRGRVQDRNSD